MNSSICALVCFILLGALALVGLILLYWNPDKKKNKAPRITKVEKDFADKILDEVKKDKKNKKRK